MTIYDDLLNIPQRENAGSLVPNRYQYQYHWSLVKMLDLYDTQDDFAMFFEFGDDILILDSVVNPSSLDFYQIKTKKQKNTFYWKLSDLTNTGTKKKPKISYLSKLIDNYTRYKYDNVKSIRFVSNLPFKFSQKDILTEQECTLGELTQDEFNTVKTSICNICKKSNCQLDCKNILYFSCTGVPIDHFREMCVGKLNNFLSKKFPNSKISPNALYEVLLKDIEIKSMNARKNKTIEELIKAKSISKEQINKQLQEFQKNTLLYNQWSEIDNKFAKIFPINQRKLIKKEFNKFIVDSLNPDNLILEQAITTIRNLIEQQLTNVDISDEELRHIFEEISNSTVLANNIDTDIYNKNYLLAIILREYCYDE